MGRFSQTQQMSIIALMDSWTQTRGFLFAFPGSVPLAGQRQCFAVVMDDHDLGLKPIETYGDDWGSPI